MADGGRYGSHNEDSPDRPQLPVGAEPVVKYEYLHADGSYAYHKLRYANPKTFRLGRPNPTPHDERRMRAQDEHNLRLLSNWIFGRGDEPELLYRLPELIAAVGPGHSVLVLEGEKDVDTARSLGFVATCNADGAGKWPSAMSKHLEQCIVTIIPDNDEAGTDHAALVAFELQGMARKVKVLELPGLDEHGDLTDWVEARRAEGKTDEQIRDSLQTLVGYAPEAVAQKPASPRKRKVQDLATLTEFLRQSPEWQGVVAYDEFRDQMMLLKPVPGTTVPKSTFRPRQWEEKDDLAALMWFQRPGRFPGVAKQVVIDAVIYEATQNVISPVRHYLEGLKWDGVPRLDRMLETYFGADVSDEEGDKPGAKATYVRAVSAAWPISAVARALEPGCKADHMLVLEGPQGLGKSTAMRVLTDGHGQPRGQMSWFNDSLQSFQGKDSMSILRGSWIVEIGELAAMRRSEVEHVKSYITRQSDRYRPAYGRKDIDVPRRSVFVGTTNEPDYLKDQTGNRRFWPVAVTKIDLLRLKEDRDQLWAEAVVRYKKDERWHLTGEAAEYQMIAAEERNEEDPWAKVLAKLADVKEVASTDVLDLLGIPLKDQTKGEKDRAAGMLARAGWRKKGKFRSGPRENLGRYENPDPKASRGQLGEEEIVKLRSGIENDRPM